MQPERAAGCAPAGVCASSGFQTLEEIVAAGTARLMRSSFCDDGVTYWRGLGHGAAPEGEGRTMKETY
jgi:hypothetical protein